jgi:hypothetical protein
LPGSAPPNPSRGAREQANHPDDATIKRSGTRRRSSWASGSAVTSCFGNGGHKFSVRLPGRIIDETVEAFAGWPRLAKKWGVKAKDIETVSRHHRLWLNGDR